MNDVSRLITRIERRLKSLPMLDDGRLDHSEHSFGEIEGLEAFLAPEGTDVDLEGEDDDLPPRSRTLLGSYRRMQSKGRITLYADNLERFALATVKCLAASDAGRLITAEELGRIAEQVVMKTYRHEEFHLFSDATTRLYRSSWPVELEEALAVAFSYRTLNASWSSARRKLPDMLHREMMKAMYRYSSRGYRDWHQFKETNDFQNGLVKRYQPPEFEFLKGSDVNVGRMLEIAVTTWPIGRSERVV